MFKEGLWEVILKKNLARDEQVIIKASYLAISVLVFIVWYLIYFIFFWF